MANESVADDAWPRADKVYCEAQGSVIPGVAEFFNAVSALALVAAGLIPMLTSPFVDELTDLASAALAINGVFSFAVHAFPYRFLGTLDHISIMFMSLLYLKSLLMAQFPDIYRSPVRHSAVSLCLVLTILWASAWNEWNVPKRLATWDPVIVTGPFLLLILGYMWIRLMYSDANWHVGRLKRILLGGMVSFFLSCVCWLVEENYLRCPAMFTLHPLWHILSAHALLCWMCFAKYHRGRFFGFDVQLRGNFLCPYVCWAPTKDPRGNPIVRHSAGRKTRRNSYLAAQFSKCKDRSKVDGGCSGVGVWFGPSCVLRPTEPWAMLPPRRPSFGPERSSRGGLSERSSRGQAELEGSASRRNSDHPVSDQRPIIRADHRVLVRVRSRGSKRIRSVWRGGSFYGSTPISNLAKRASLAVRRASTAKHDASQDGAGSLRAFQQSIGVLVAPDTCGPGEA